MNCSQTLTSQLCIDRSKELLKIHREWLISRDFHQSGEEPEISPLQKLVAMSQSFSREALTQTISSKVCLEIATLLHPLQLLLSGLIELKDASYQTKLMFKECLESICISMVFSKPFGLMTTSLFSMIKSPL